MRKKRNDKEHLEQAAFFEWVNLHKHFYHPLRGFFAVPNGGSRNIVTAVKLKKEGVVRGVADVFNLYSSKNCKHTAIAIEFKIKGNCQSPHQKAWQEIAEDAGVCYVVCYSCQEAICETKKYFGIYNL